jgi:hypothetical protein
MTDDEIRARLGDAMDGLTSAWAAIETVLVELRDRELRADMPDAGTLNRPVTCDSGKNLPGTFAWWVKHNSGTPSIQERPY